MDADGLSLTSRIQLPVDFLEEDSDVAALGGAIDEVNSRGQTLYKVHYRLNYGGLLSG